MKSVEDFVAGPRIYFGWKWTTMVDESTLNLTVILHGTTQTRSIILLMPFLPFLQDCLTSK